jgi:hypothetical protein
MSLFGASVIVIGVAACAIAAMLVVRRRAPDGSCFEDGDRAAGVFGVLATGFAVLAGFVVFLAFESYDTSRSGAEAEARIVAQQFETVQFLPEPARGRLSGELVCYARSVVHMEWPRMDSGTLDDAPNPWGVVVTEANAIGTTYLRAQTLAEPVRSRSLDLLVRYTRSALRLSDAVPGSDEADAARAQEERIGRRLWSLAGDALDTAPTASAPRLYVETLNEMFDAETVRVASLSNRVPTAVLALEVLGSALALGLLAAYLAIVGRGVLAVLLASALVAFLLLVTTDLGRPTRGMIQVPDTVLRDQLASMEEPPATTAPRSP